MQFLEREDFIAFNKDVINDYTGTFVPPNNLKNAEGLDYLIDICENNEIFGVQQYPTIAHIAALLLFKITSNHLFNDGNKRTAYSAAVYFLHLNGHRFRDKIEPVIKKDKTFVPKRLRSQPDHILEDLIQEIAQSQLEYEEVLLFVQNNIEAKPYY